MTSIRPIISTVIPLYKSKRFVNDIISNIKNIKYHPSEIIISDRHGLDDAIDILDDFFSDDPRVICIKKTDQANWVENIDSLLRQATGRFWRVMPHDDLFAVCDLEAMCQIFLQNQDLVAIYGPVHGIDMAGHPIASRTRTTPKPENGYRLSLSNSLLVNFHDYFNGAFKGLIDRKKVVDNQAWIKKTNQLMSSERCWLFALSLLGRFHYYDQFHYEKRFYSESTSAAWRFTTINQLSLIYLHISYLWKLGHRFSHMQRLLGSLTLIYLGLRNIIRFKFRSKSKLLYYIEKYPSRNMKNRWITFMDAS